ncbi:MAG: integrase core domain-containing protein [Methyloligellaceae bacterium]
MNQWKFRAERLKSHWFMSLEDAQRRMVDWRKDCNEVGPHSTAGNKPQISLMNGPPASSPS